MKPLRPDTFVLTLPDGKPVRCWRREAAAIRRDVFLTGNVFLRQDPATEVYERVDPNSVEAVDHVAVARHVTG